MDTLKYIFNTLDPATDGASVKYDHYFNVYDRILGPLRTIPITMLEIGIEKGGSLTMWKKYLHPESKIVALDRVPGCKKNERDNIIVEIGDQMDGEFLNKLANKHGPFDIIIDDGGHYTDQHMNCFINLFPFVKELGYYIVEDTHTCYMQEFKDGKPTVVDHFKNVADLVTTDDKKLYNFESVQFYRSMVVLRKGNPAPRKILSPGFEGVAYPQ